MIPEAGHYPQSQQPDATSGAVLTFLEIVGDRHPVWSAHRSR
jgi:hypothetical protein